MQMSTCSKIFKGTAHLFCVFIVWNLYWNLCPYSHTIVQKNVFERGVLDIDKKDSRKFTCMFQDTAILTNSLTRDK